MRPVTNLGSSWTEPNPRPDEFVFVFDGGTNLDPEKDMHIHGVRIKFEKDGQVTSAWDGYTGGKKAGTTTFEMTRKSEVQCSGLCRGLPST